MEKITERGYKASDFKEKTDKANNFDRRNLKKYKY